MSKKKVKKSDEKAFTFSITVFAKTKEDAVAKFLSEEIHPADMNIGEQSADAHDYVTNRHAECPKCGEGDLEGHGVEIYTNQAWQKVTCNSCGCKFNDIYTLTDVEVHE
jgi:hypothetical protein